ncbi:hypothetical protein J1771_gp68 [Gordonia phage MelBins]|uniref:Uncharacterized protein n=1 Tax=Gordonia phage MelBins TaxID=2656540 RepID=A0A649VNW1_9CAUD|nr:hypothetical protein J1771_gp68 [Gordonia phage MelBins]QGJ93622.1 hypothetical protein SEA_MELBINS_68 [Gordonia phage MelBins]
MNDDAPVPASTTPPGVQTPMGIVWDHPDRDHIRARVVTEAGDGTRELVATIYYTHEQAAEMLSQLLGAMR